MAGGRLGLVRSDEPAARVRIALVFPRFKMPTGAERFIFALARAATELGAEVTVEALEVDERCRSLVPPDVSVRERGVSIGLTGHHYLDSAYGYLRSFALGAALGRSRRVRYDAVVFFAAASVPALAGHAVARGRGARLYFCFEPPRFAYDDLAAIRRRLGVAGLLLGPLAATWRRVDRRLVALAERVLVFGPFIEGRVHRLYPGARTSRVTPSLALPGDRDPRGRDAVIAGHGLDPRRPVVTTVNFLHPRKRVDLFLDVVAALDRRVQGLVVGEGPERAALEARSRALGLGERIRFAGFVPDASIAAVYRATDVYLHTALAESFGLTVLEAGACGVPVVAVAEGGVRDSVVDGVTGLLVPADVASLAGATASLLDAPARARALGAAARHLVPERFSAERLTAELAAALVAAGVTPSPPAASLDEGTPCAS